MDEEGKYDYVHAVAFHKEGTDDRFVLNGKKAIFILDSILHYALPRINLMKIEYEKLKEDHPAKEFLKTQLLYNRDLVEPIVTFFPKLLFKPETLDLIKWLNTLGEQNG